MIRLNVDDARCEALFASGLQRSDAPTARKRGRGDQPRRAPVRYPRLRQQLVGWLGVSQ